MLCDILAQSFNKNVDTFVCKFLVEYSTTDNYQRPNKIRISIDVVIEQCRADDYISGPDTLTNILYLKWSVLCQNIGHKTIKSV